MRHDFYQLERDRADAVVPVLAARALGTGARLSVACDDEAERGRLSAALWAADGFLAHGEPGGADEERQPILLGGEGGTANGATLLLVADGRWRDAPAGIERVLFLFRPDQIADARARWTALEGGERHYWAQRPEGGWVEKG